VIAAETIRGKSAESGICSILRCRELRQIGRKSADFDTVNAGVKLHRSPE